MKPLQQKIHSGLLHSIQLLNKEQSDIFYDLAFEYAQCENNKNTDFVLDCAFVKRVICACTQDEREDLVFVSGYRVGGVCIPNQIIGSENTQRTVVSATLSASYTAQGFLKIRGQGYETPLVFHSHPGRGIGCVTPSQTDLDWLGALQASGCMAVGGIVSRDGFIRIFTVSVPFTVTLRGNQIEEVEEHVYKIHK